MLHPDHPVRRRLRPLRRLVSSRRSIWRRGLPHEVEFWAEYLRTKGGEFPEDYHARLDPEAAITDPLILAALDGIASQPVRILDVGAGPMTAVGKRDPRDMTRKIEIVAIDPLADEYSRMLEEFSVAAPVRTVQCTGEDIMSAFAPDSFDVGYSRNAIDHSVEPMRIITNMVEVVRPGGVIVLRHYRREAEAMRYEQLHQWNFDVDDGRLLLWSKRHSYDVAAQLLGRASVTARIYHGSYHADWVEASISPIG